MQTGYPLIYQQCQEEFVPQPSDMSASPAKSAHNPFNTTGRFGNQSSSTSTNMRKRRNNSQMKTDPSMNNISSQHAVLTDEEGSNLFMRPETKNDGGQQLPERAITPITYRELETGRLENVMDNTLDQYIEDLREANKQADIKKLQLDQEEPSKEINLPAETIVAKAEPEMHMQPQQTDSPKNITKNHQQKLQPQRVSYQGNKNRDSISSKGLKITSPVRKTRKNSNGRPIKTEESNGFGKSPSPLSTQQMPI